jgi:hypothetical protein
MYYKVSEQSVTYYATEYLKRFPDESNNAFVRALEIGEMWRNIEMSPLYFYEPDGNKLVVSSEETLGKTFH